MIRYDEIGSIGKQLIALVNQELVLKIIIGIGIVISIIRKLGNSIYVVIITALCMYIVMNYTYGTRLKSFRKNKLIQKQHILNKICKNKKHKSTELCENYQLSTRNYNNIMDMLLQHHK